MLVLTIDTSTPFSPTQHHSLIASCVVDARRRGVAPHKVPAFVRRRLGGGITVVRLRSDGTPGCSAPCLLCARELARFDLKVCCRLDSGAVWCGRLSDPGAPPPKVTSGQRSWLAHWDACRWPVRGGAAGGTAADGDGGALLPSDAPDAGSGPPNRRRA